VRAIWTFLAYYVIFITMPQPDPTCEVIGGKHILLSVQWCIFDNQILVCLLSILINNEGPVTSFVQIWIDPSNSAVSLENRNPKRPITWYDSTQQNYGLKLEIYKANFTSLNIID
jgi:hypothetical protein